MNTTSLNPFLIEDKIVHNHRVRIKLETISVGYGNENIEPLVLVEMERPKPEDWIWTRLAWHSGSVPYVGYHEESGLYRFFAHQKSNESGYGGSKFKLRMDDGTEAEIKGPWSSNAKDISDCIIRAGGNLDLTECSVMWLGSRNHDIYAHEAISIMRICKAFGDMGKHAIQRLGGVNRDRSEHDRQWYASHKGAQIARVLARLL